MKGVILAGGTGSRLESLTTVLNKHLVAVGNVPMIEYPLRTLSRMRVDDITVVTGIEHAGTVISYLTKRHSEIDFTYKIQKEAGGIAQAIGLVENVCRGNKLAVILGDNIFENDFAEPAKKFYESDNGVMLFLKQVSDPHRFGVAELDSHGNILSIVEKPEKPKSNLVVSGLYLYDDTVFDKIKTLVPSDRGELEVSDLNQMYISEGRAVSALVNGFWSDAGTLKSLKVASDFAIEKNLFPSKRI